jgi:hypothetical protein
VPATSRVRISILAHPPSPLGWSGPGSHWRRRTAPARRAGGRRGSAGAVCGIVAGSVPVHGRYRPRCRTAIRHKLFQPFVTVGKRSGLGLSLAFTRQTVLGHEGEISVTSLLGGGARFSHVVEPRPLAGNSSWRPTASSESITSRTGSQIATAPLTRCRKLPKTSSIHGSNGARHTHFEQTGAPSLLSKLSAT